MIKTITLKVRWIVKTSICRTYCTDCGSSTPHLVTVWGSCRESYSCGVCGAQKAYSVK